MDQSFHIRAELCVKSSPTKFLSMVRQQLNCFSQRQTLLKNCAMMHCNRAQRRYLEMQNQLLQNLRGKWVAISSKGIMAVAPSEYEVQQIADLAFPSRVDEYYANLVGCEIMCSAIMDHYDSEPEPEKETPVPENLSSWVFRDQFLIKAEILPRI